ncbi:MAG: acyloxyacyl hydrolase [Candidatus Midichloriaceae bacterium]|jgi:hypothetical protein|nr:acyloxyacyl hydrolase [Candidatus Midichloriaceae bacterium]
MQKFLLWIILSLVSAQVFAKDEIIYVAPQLGTFDINGCKKRFAGGAEVRMNFIHKIMVPKLGAYITSKGSSYYYAGFNLELPVYKESLYLMPGFAAGGYSKGRGKVLGSVLEFYSSIEMNYKFKNLHRIGINFGHISNAGICKKNPGSENIFLTYSIPLSNFLKFNNTISAK